MLLLVRVILAARGLHCCFHGRCAWIANAASEGRKWGVGEGLPASRWASLLVQPLKWLSFTPHPLPYGAGKQGKAGLRGEGGQHHRPHHLHARRVARWAVKLRTSVCLACAPPPCASARTHTCVHLHIDMCMCVCVHTRTHTNTHTHKHTHTLSLTHTHIYTRTHAVDDYLDGDALDTSLDELRTHQLCFAQAPGRTDEMQRKDDADSYVVRASLAWLVGGGCSRTTGASRMESYVCALAKPLVPCVDLLDRKSLPTLPLPQVYDPLLEKAKGKFSLAAQKEKKRGNQWAGRSNDMQH